MVARRRAEIPGARRVVIKVGSSSITGENKAQLDVVTAALAALRGHGSDVVLVSSGAIATGFPALGLGEKPTDLPTQQAAASIGQTMLISRYQDSLRHFGLNASQVLLTAGDFDDLTHRRNAQRAFDRLLEFGVIPIVNENDTVATHEIRFGDNDRLAALVAVLVRADVLILLSDVDALYTAPPDRSGAVKIPTVSHNDQLDGVEFGPATSTGVGTGGATTKVASARLAADAGVPVLMTATSLVEQAISGEDVGTWFEPFAPHLSTRTGAIATVGNLAHQ
ncbi:MAG TPA: glutamate 5-kinase [Pseudoclavibacter sp.]|nr:glutamate 5-kinase [Pseudoclavibacter sp.]